jgi:hypothetical protein
VTHEHVDLAGQQIGHRRRRAAVGHVHQLDPGAQAEQLGGQMRRCSVAGRTVGDLPPPPLRLRHQVLHRPDPQRLAHHNDLRHREHQGRRREVAQRVVGHARHEVRHHRQRARRGEDDGVAVRPAARDGLHADDAAGARAVVHHHGLAEPVPHDAADQPGDGVARPARGEGHDHPHRLVGEVLRARGPEAGAGG